jgi:hypothetical protein
VADYFMSFSTEIPDLTPAEIVWIEQDLARQNTGDMDEAEIAALRERTGLAGLDGRWLAFQWENTDDGLWLHADDYFDVDHVRSFVQRFIQECRPAYIFQMTWADTCSNPRLDSFGGGWLVVSRDTWLSSHTANVVAAAAARLRAERADEDAARSR